MDGVDALKGLAVDNEDRDRSMKSHPLHILGLPLFETSKRTISAVEALSAKQIQSVQSMVWNQPRCRLAANPSEDNLNENIDRIRTSDLLFGDILTLNSSSVAIQGQSLSECAVKRFGPFVIRHSCRGSGVTSMAYHEFAHWNVHHTELTKKALDRICNLNREHRQIL